MKKILTTLAIIIATITVTTSLVLAATGTVNIQGLNFRPEPTTDSDIIQKLDEGEKVNIISEEDDGWYKISYNGREGYVRQEYVDRDTSEVTENTVAQETPAIDEPEEAASDDVQDSPNTTSLKEVATLYVLPLLNSTNLGVLQSGQKVLLVSVNGPWSYIQTATKSGWVWTSKLEKSEITITASKPVVEETIPTSTEPEEPKLDIQVPENVVENTTTENTVSEEPAQEETKQEEETSQEETSSYPKTMYVKVEDANVRSKPNTESTILTSVERKDSVKVIGKEGDWYKVETSDGTGYIRADLLSE